VPEGEWYGCGPSVDEWFHYWFLWNRISRMRITLGDAQGNTCIYVIFILYHVRLSGSAFLVDSPLLFTLIEPISFP
jgi:hypothetical protein